MTTPGEPVREIRYLFEWEISGEEPTEQDWALAEDLRDRNLKINLPLREAAIDSAQFEWVVETLFDVCDDETDMGDDPTTDRLDT